MSQTRTRTCALSDSSHSRTGATNPVARDAFIALVTSSETTSSVLSSAASPHSHSSCRACSGRTAPRRAARRVRGSCGAATGGSCRISIVSRPLCSQAGRAGDASALVEHAGLVKASDGQGGPLLCVAAVIIHRCAPHDSSSGPEVGCGVSNWVDGIWGLLRLCVTSCATNVVGPLTASWPRCVITGAWAAMTHRHCSVARLPAAGSRAGSGLLPRHRPGPARGLAMSSDLSATAGSARQIAASWAS